MSVIEAVHGGYIHRRRVQVLCNHLVDLLPQNAQVLDVGCGDGLLAKEIMRRRPDVAIVGIDTLVRDHCLIPVQWFDGKTIPMRDASCQLVMLVDVLHHTDDPMVLLREARRVVSKAIIIKDHTRNGLLAGPTLRFMDWVGNHGHGVALPYNYWEKSRWRQALTSLGMKETMWEQNLGLYPPPASWVFERSLHFLCYWSCPGFVDGERLSGHAAGPCFHSMAEPRRIVAGKSDVWLPSVLPEVEDDQTRLSLGPEPAPIERIRGWRRASRRPRPWNSRNMVGAPWPS